MAFCSFVGWCQLSDRYGATVLWHFVVLQVGANLSDRYSATVLWHLVVLQVGANLSDKYIPTPLRLFAY
jgi:hypothetical protein